MSTYSTVQYFAKQYGCLEPFIFSFMQSNLKLTAVISCLALKIPKKLAHKNIGLKGKGKELTEIC